MGRRKGKTVRLGDAMNGLIRRVDRGGGMATARVVDVWCEVVGEQVARHTAGVTLHAGELVVRVDSHAWAAELQVLSETLKERVNLVLGETPVEKIRFTVSRRVADERHEEQRAHATRRGYGGVTVTPEPLSPEELEAVEASAGSIRSEELREAAIRATVRGLEWKKAQKHGKSGDTPPHEATDASTGLLP